VDIAVSNTNIIQVAADLLVLKHADGFYGADKAVAKILGFNGHIKVGDSRFFLGKGVAAQEVVFLGVGPLGDFRYARIQEFGSRAIKLVRQHHRPIQHLALTVHGPGYGLDSEQSFLSMVAGLVAEWKRAPNSLEQITVAELSDKRCVLLNSILQERLHEFGLVKSVREATVRVAESPEPIQRRTTKEDNIVQFGTRAEQQPCLFVAMPFSEEFVDEFEIGFHEAAKASAFICERLDLSSFTGDIVTEIKKRIISSHGVIALLNDLNPNVFLEVGFAWAHGKPTILVAKEGLKLPFDVSGHKCVLYRNIRDLRKALSAEIASLKAQGVLAKTA
jgi:hypothetical protein